MPARGGRTSAYVIAIALTALPLFAQTQNDRIQQLQTRLDQLLQQANDIQAQLNALKGAAPAAQAATPPAEPAQPAEEDLTKIDVEQPAKTAQAPPAQPQGANVTNEQPATALTDVQALNNQINPAASKVFNPDTSVIGNFLGKAGSTNPYEFGSNDMRRPLQLDEAEVGFQAWVDPYLKANFFLSLTPGKGIDAEEAYAQAVTLPYGLTAKVGKFKALFGKANTWHTHVRPWVDQPLMIHNFFGDEQLADSGVSLSELLPVKFAVVELTGELFRGDVENVWHATNENDLGYNTHVKVFKDISENSNIELGGSYARGTLPDTALVRGANQFGAVDVTYRWKPLEQGLYNSLIYRFEGLVNRRDDYNGHLTGFYTSLDKQLGQRWFTGVRLDRANRLVTGDNGARAFVDNGVSATLTFWPSEFSQLRGQVRHTSYGGLKSVNELLFQMQFAIGAHGAHAF